MGLFRLHRSATLRVLVWRQPSLLLSAAFLSCGGHAHHGETDQQLCERAADYIRSCGAATTFPVDCEYLGPDVACDNRCDLEVSCDYFRGDSPSESRSRAQCGSRCTCESAQRRATECAMPPALTCDDICNCPYSNDCQDGVPAYAACRAQCPPWPG
jgi:hypothetical protein